MMSINDIAQWAGVLIAVGICVYFLVRKLIGRNSEKDSREGECSECELLEICKKKSSKRNKGCH